MVQFIFNRNWLLKNKNFITQKLLVILLLMKTHLDIDEYEDFEYAEYMLKRLSNMIKNPISRSSYSHVP